MSTIAEKIAELGYTVPEIAAPVAAYVPATQVGNFVYTSGQIPLVEGKVAGCGKVKNTNEAGFVSLAQAQKLVEVCTLNALAAVQGVVGSLDKIKRVVKVTVFVASDPEFTDQALVANGASLLLGKIFGESGVHVRSAVGVAVLPLDVPVEAEFVFEIAE
ncbi:RidA family protein [Canibacter sp. lx-72]|uniref:RidA family protein n=1 Tax=Canibacter zhuwentaonis TaxID=2837491 RepID=UPI001BDC6DD3|nr:RidA family protein [Canibacter zhuwentaonis]MBT1035726.1 RidA family protein [Canibacter zhuwentaonis]